MRHCGRSRHAEPSRRSMTSPTRRWRPCSQERIRAYTAASGPLYFGRIDDASGRAIRIGRHALYSPQNELLSINWRAPAAEPFYTATTRDPRGLVRRHRIDINLLDLHVVKGLEFDAVIVVDPAAILVDRPDGGIGGLYTALTRPTRALAIVHVADLPEQLESSPTLVRLAAADPDGSWANLRRAADPLAAGA